MYATILKTLCVFLVITTTSCDEDGRRELLHDEVMIPTDAMIPTDVIEDLGLVDVVSMQDGPIEIEPIRVPEPEVLTPIKKKHFTKMTGKMESHVSGKYHFLLCKSFNI